MKWCLVLVGMCVLVMSMSSAPVAEAAPALQFPWPSGLTQHRIAAGNCTYNCLPFHITDYNNQYAVDFEFNDPINGDPVTATARGVVTEADHTADARGNFIEIDHGGGYRSRYLHLRRDVFGGPWPPNIAEGVWVEQGQHVGYSGDSGDFPAHLHFDLKLDGAAYLPEPMSGQRGFGAYGSGQGGDSPYWFSRPVRWPVGNFHTAHSRVDIMHHWSDNWTNTWRSLGDGSFTVSSATPGSGYNMSQGTWQNGNYNLGNARDLIHLCCQHDVRTWLGNGSGQFGVYFFDPPGTYGIQLGSWQAGRFITGLDSLLHICCTNYVHLWTSNGNGTWAIGPAWQVPGNPDYGMQLGTWHAGDFDGDGFLDLFHAWGGNNANTWFSTGGGGFNVVSYSPGPGYGIGLGSWRVGDFDGDGDSDLVHLWGAHAMNMWRSNRDGTYQVTPVTLPAGDYGVQQGHWIAGKFTQPGARDDLIHICCKNYANVWKSNGSGGFTWNLGWAPNPTYGMLEGSWHKGDLTRDDGRTDLLHAWGSDYANILKPRTDNSGFFDVNSYQPIPGYCMLC